MNTPRFDIFKCTIMGYRSVFAERQYLMSAALVPMALTTGIEMVKFYAVDKHTVLTALLTMLPVALAAAWFMFLQTRLLVFGERADNVAPENAASRKQAFEISAILWMLIQMAGLAMLAFSLYLAREGRADTVNPMLSIAGYLMLGCALWGVRLAIAHILGAIGYSIRQYIFKVNGAMVSLRMIGLMLAVALPILLFSAPIEAMFFAALQAEDVTVLQVAGATVLRVVMNFLLLAFFNAAAVFALRDMLGKNGTWQGINT